jgi:nucleoid DNA-binding protein
MAKYTKTFLMKEIATRANFNQSDVKIIWDTFEEIFHEMVIDHDELVLDGFFHMKIVEKKPYRGVDVKTGKPKDFGTGYRLVLGATPLLKSLVHYKKHNPPKAEEIKED